MQISRSFLFIDGQHSIVLMYHQFQQSIHHLDIWHDFEYNLYKPSYRPGFSLLLGKYLRVESWIFYFKGIFNFIRYCQTIFQSVSVAFLPATYESSSSSCSTHPHRHYCQSFFLSFPSFLPPPFHPSILPSFGHYDSYVVVSYFGFNLHFSKD